MNIIILSDNTPNTQISSLHHEHGLSMFIEYMDKNILCDFGESSIFAQNAKLLNIDLSKLDYAFVSHAHHDHTGGLAHFLEKYKANIFASPDIFHNEYFSSRNNSSKRNISTDQDLLMKYTARFNFISKSQWIDKKIAIIRCNNTLFPTPLGNSHLYKNECKDNFSHEISLAFLSPSGLIIISSCAHCGILNIIEAAQSFTNTQYVNAFIGGLHIVDSPQCIAESTELTKALTTLHPNIKIFTGHCTSDKAKEFLLNSNLNINIFHVGKYITL